MKKTQRISESWAREQLFETGRADRVTRQVGTKENLTDLFTKVLPREDYWRLMEELSMMKKGDFRAMVVHPDG